MQPGSALGQKRKCKKAFPLYPNSDRKSDFPEKAMSALPPNADICAAIADVRFGPKADIMPSFDQHIEVDTGQPLNDLADSST